MKIHMLLQGKGGVGKSFISSAIAQYKHSKGQTPLCIDTDPVNSTFHGYKSLNVRRLDIMEGDEINPRKFDLLIEWLSETEIDDVVIDNGAATFVPLSHYLINNQVPVLLQGMGYELVIHTVVTGGQGRWRRGRRRIVGHDFREAEAISSIAQINRPPGSNLEGRSRECGGARAG